MKNKILVTGSEGFIGSHLVEKLVENGECVKALVHYNSFNSYGWLDQLNKSTLEKIEIITGDIRDNQLMNNITSNCKKVIHLAALIAIPYSFIAPKSYVETNVLGTINILEACKNNNVERILITSTSEVYGTAKYVPIDEFHPRQAQSPYSASKISADAISESYYKSFNLPISIVRPFNTYGPRQSSRAIIPNVIVQALNNVKKIKLGDLTPTRDFLYVKDTAEGFIKILNCNDLIGQDVNIATNNEITMLNVVNHIIEKINPEIGIEIDSNRIRPKKSEVFRLFGSNKKIRKYTDWKPSYDFKSGIDETIQWFSSSKNLSFYKHNIYNI